MAKSLNNLRNESRRLIRNARRKMNRIGMSDFSDHNPLQGVTTANLDDMNRRQLESLNKRLMKFNDRGTQFIQNRYGTFISMDAVKEYESAKLQYNRRVGIDFDRVKDVIVPDTGMTVKQNAYMEHNDLWGIGPKTRLDIPHEGDARDYANEKVLLAQAKHLRRMATPHFRSQAVKKARNELSQMLDAIGGVELPELNDKQFAALWSATDMANLIKIMYEVNHPNPERRPKQKFLSDIADSNRSKVGELVKWASLLKV